MTRDVVAIVLLRVFGFSLIVAGILMFLSLLPVFILSGGVVFGKSGLDVSWSLFVRFFPSAMNVVVGLVVLMKSRVILRGLFGLGRDKEGML